MRLFIAVELPPAVRETVASVGTDLSTFSRLMKIVSPELIHITVRFLGSTPASRLSDVEAAVHEASHGAHPFELQLSQVGMFPGGSKPPRVVWVGLRHDDGYSALQQVFGLLEAALERRGFVREKRGFSPHLTVARVREDAPGGEARALGEAVKRLRDAGDVRGRFEVRELTVMRSDLSPSGPRYTPLVRSPLGSKGEGAAP